jgi:WD40-like Beta Propeller Repeat
MTDELDVLTRLVGYHDHIAAPTVPVADDVHRGRRRLARRRRLAAGGVALVVAAIVLTASVVTGSAPDGAPDPARTTTPTPTETHTAIDPVLRNGQITGAQRFFGVEAGHYMWRSFDPVSETGLFVTNVNPDRSDDFEGLTVVGPTGPLATLTCARDLRCPPEESYLSYAATLGPAADEVTVGSADATAQVIGFDGTLRRTIDLGATTTGGGVVAGLRWSADGSRLAVVTFQFLGEHDATVTRAWLVDREGGDAQRAYSLWLDETSPIEHAGADFDGEGAIWTASGWGWSPDGQSLLLDVRTPGQRTEYGAVVVVLHVPPDGPATAQTLYHSNRHFDWAGNVAWSPDGTRIAVRTRVPGTLMRHRVTEISAEDGSVIAQHPHINDWLIWPAREG